MPFRRSSSGPDPAGAGSMDLQIWRITTAARVFVLATAAGQLVAAASAEALWTWVALAVVTAACCVAELPLAATRTLFVPLAESAAAVAVLMLGPGPAEPLTVYLVIPALVAGVRLGGRAASATVATTTAALFLAHAFGPGGHPGPGVLRLVPWVVVGLGAGLLAASLTRTVRRQASREAPYVSAQRLLAQWEGLVAGRQLNLDLSLLCRELQTAVCSATGATGSAVWVRGPRGEPRLLAAEGCAGGPAAEVIGCLDAGTGRSGPGTVVLPLRSGETTFGALCLEVDRAPGAAVLSAAQDGLDEHAFRLRTALVLDAVRCRATTEERRRLARDIHDGVAQRLAAVAHLSDEIAAGTPDDEAPALAGLLRHEVVTIIEELRSSVLDLREDEPGGLSATLATAVDALGRHSPLRVHLSLDERCERLPMRTEAEVVRIAREAIGNVGRHARAANLWVTLTTDGSGLTLSVTDDGVGCARPRAGHFGLHTMRERAELVGAQLGIAERPGGGTVVTLRAPTNPIHEERPHDHHRLARR